MTRSEFLRTLGVATGWAGLRLASPLLLADSQPEPAVLNIGLGPQLFLDDYVIERMDGLVKRVQPPERLAKPVLDSKTFGTTQPYLTVLEDPDTKRYRLWDDRGPAIWHAESADGIRWEKPRLAWDLPRSYGASLVDDRGREKDPDHRFKLANWQATRKREDKPGDDGGMYVGFSPDGFRWTRPLTTPVLPTWPEGHPTISRHGIGDIVDVFYDSLHQRYVAARDVH